MSDKFILDGHRVVPCDDLLIWARWFEQASRDGSRIVAKTDVGQMRVSTVFLGLDHGIGDGPPLVFETMIFGHPTEEEWQERCSTWDEAEAMHARAVEIAARALTPPPAAGEGPR